MKIAYVTGMYGRASDTFIRNEVVELRLRGHRVDTFSVRRPIEDGASAIVEAERATTCYIVEAPKGRLIAAFLRMLSTRPRRMARSFAMAMRSCPTGIGPRTMHSIYWLEAVYLAAQLIDRGIEILHNHIAENSATVAMLASEISGVPFSMTVHGPAIFWHPARWALREKIARAAFTACISDFCRSQCMVHSDPIDWKKLQVIRCGVGREFENTAIAPPTDARRVLFVGRLCQEKAVPVLMDAIARCARAQKPYRFALIGNGPLTGSVQAFVDEHRLHDVVELLGWQSTADVVAELRASRAFVLPSLAEGLPVAIMEALAIGRPVITTAIAGIPELVRPEHGWLVVPGSVESLVAAIDEVMEAPVERLAAMGRSGAAAVRAMHSLQHEVDKLEAGFAQVVARRAGARVDARFSPSLS